MNWHSVSVMAADFNEQVSVASVRMEAIRISRPCLCIHPTLTYRKCKGMWYCVVDLGVLTGCCTRLIGLQTPIRRYEKSRRDNNIFSSVRLWIWHCLETIAFPCGARARRRDFLSPPPLCLRRLTGTRSPRFWVNCVTVLYRF